MNTARRQVGWWRALAFCHRWLGVAGGLLLLLWLVSGVAMIYVRMPELTEGERLERTRPIDAELVRMSVDDALTAADADVSTPIALGMHGARPVYRIGAPAPVTIFADTGGRLSSVTTDDSLSAAGAFAPEAAGAVRHLETLAIADQWSLQLRQHFPLHRVAIADGRGTEVYVSSVTGEVVLDTTRRERLWAYVGPVAHWLYLPVLRRNGPLWTQVVIWTAAAGCVLCLTGLVAGLWRFAPLHGYDSRSGWSRSPYAGWMRWHHYAGLLFGVVTATWTFSGLLSMGPFAWLSDPGPTPAQQHAVAGGLGAPLAITDAMVRRAIRAVDTRIATKELELVAFRGHAYWLGRETPSARALVSAEDPRSAFARFDDAEVEAAAHAGAPAGTAVDLTWLDAYDDYYYDRGGAAPLPILRARYVDGTWLYVDPSHGRIARAVGPRDRVNRWLYHGLHSLDPAWLRNRRPLWDTVVIVLSLGGIAGAVTSLVPGWRRLRGYLRR